MTFNSVFDFETEIQYVIINVKKKKKYGIRTFKLVIFITRGYCGKRIELRNFVNINSSLCTYIVNVNETIVSFHENS